MTTIKLEISGTGGDCKDCHHLKTEHSSAYQLRHACTAFIRDGERLEGTGMRALRSQRCIDAETRGDADAERVVVLEQVISEMQAATRRALAQERRLRVHRPVEGTAVEVLAK